MNNRLRVVLLRSSCSTIALLPYSNVRRTFDWICAASLVTQTLFRASWLAFILIDVKMPPGLSGDAPVVDYHNSN